MRMSLYVYRVTCRSVSDTLEKHHNTSPDCAIVYLHSSFNLNFFAILIKQNLARHLSYTYTMIYVGFKVI